ncbi:DEKNAAC104609 [Brettanomyces naardenensis]|uniref:DEKNAAC104609 n=1 Tax=Brettanomyces naardenensis TaxID=13370 RepID=A0A448YR55_BRENA|nr:DEKNAAC104609 [Brettanomyces naardenensis]
MVDSSEESQTEEVYQDAQNVHNNAEEDLIMAAKALGQLKGSTPSPPAPNMVETVQETPTIFDKVTSHPLISNSINYMLERTIHASSSYLQNPDAKGQHSPPASNSHPAITTTTTAPIQSSAFTSALSSERYKRPSSSLIGTNSLEIDGLGSTKRPRLSSNISGSLSDMTKLPPLIPSASSAARQQPYAAFGHARFPRVAPNLRQQVTITSAISAQKSLQDLTELSVINLNIESRKRLEMLIHFLKLGNSQLSECIENLMKMVESRRQDSVLSSPRSPAVFDSDTEPSDNGHNDLLTEDNRIHAFDNSSTTSLTSLPRANSVTSIDSNSQFFSDESIQQMKDDIVTTVKKIVNVVSKVSANSLSEPARSNVREALLRLPSNWAAIFEQEQQQQQRTGGAENMDVDEGEDDDSDSEYSDSETLNSDNTSIDTRYEDSREELHNQDGKSKGVVKKEKSPPAKHIRRSVTQRLLANLFRYRGGVSSRSTTTFQAKQWFKSKIRNQMMYDPNGKILILAQESLDMINKIIKFCNESLDKAENWNTSKQQQQRQTLMSKLKGMNYVSAAAHSSENSSPNRDGEEIETIVVKSSEDSS